MGKLVGSEFGDIIKDHSMDTDSIQYCGVFVREETSITGTVKLLMTDTRGRFWAFANNEASNLEVDSHIDFEAYLQDYNEKLKAVANA
tara:strand:+ start:454 stop:717 length:264 start_codon:yes stop_codon:yes gene_type:complete